MDDFEMLENEEKIYSLNFAFNDKIITASTSKGLRMFLSNNFECIHFVEIPGGVLHSIIFQVDRNAKINFGFVGTGGDYPNNKVYLVD